MQRNAGEPLRVTQETIAAHAQQDGFFGREKIRVEHGCRVIVPQEAVVALRRTRRSRPGAHPAFPADRDRDRSRALPADLEKGGLP